MEAQVNETPENQNLYRSLKFLGLSSDAIKLYSLLSGTKERNYSKFAQYMEISRPYLYKILEELKNSGLITFPQKKSEITIFPPTEILARLRDKKNQLNSLEMSFVNMLPGLMDSYEQGNFPSKIKLIQGEDNLIKLFFQIIEEEDKISEYFGSAADFIGFISWKKEREWIKTRLKKGLKIKALLLPSEDARTLQTSDKNELRETRIFLSKSLFITSFQLFSNKLIFWQPRAKLAILVEDEYLVSMMKAIFNFCWQNSKK